MIDHLHDRLEQDPIRQENVVIASANFFQVVETAAKENRYGKDISSALLKIETGVKEQSLRCLYIPVFHNGHEVAAYVDFETRQYGYGM